MFDIVGISVGRELGNHSACEIGLRCVYCAAVNQTSVIRVDSDHYFRLAGDSR
jgi:hypothetical protein